jgi:putative copper export protein
VGVDDLWTLVRFGHVLGVTLWLGGMIVMGAVVVPIARAAGDRGLITRAARRFGVLGAAAWVLILATGFGLIEHRGLSVADLPDTEYGRRVLAKLILLLAMGVVVALHAAWQGPRVTRSVEAGDERAARRWRILGVVFDSALLLGSLAALWLAVSLVP